MKESVYYLHLILAIIAFSTSVAGLIQSNYILALSAVIVFLISSITAAALDETK